MATIDEIRRANLLLLIQEAGSNKAFADKLGVSESQLSQWSRGALVSSTGKPRGMRTDTAQRIEAAAGKPAGWLDTPRHVIAALGAMRQSNVEPMPAPENRVPLISWVQAGEWCDAADPFEPGDAEDWMPCPQRTGPNAFALRVQGDSMDGPGGYREGEIIYVDPSVDAAPGRDVVARTPDGRVTFKRLKQDETGRYLLALNPDWPERIIRVPEGTVICGVVVGSYTPR